MDELEQHDKSDLSDIVNIDFESSLLYDSHEDFEGNQLKIKEDKRNSAIAAVVMELEKIELFTINVTFAGRKKIVLIDGAAQLNLISRPLAARLIQTKTGQYARNEDYSINDVQGNPVPTFGIIKTKFEICKTIFEEVFVIVESPPKDAILGLPFLSKNEVDVQHGLDTLYFRRTGKKVKKITTQKKEQSYESSPISEKHLPPNSIGWVKCHCPNLKSIPPEVNQVFAITADIKDPSIRLLSPWVIPDKNQFLALIANDATEKCKLTRHSLKLTITAVPTEDMKPVKLTENCTIATVLDNIEPKVTESVNVDEEIMQILKKVKIGTAATRQQRKRIFQLTCAKTQGLKPQCLGHRTIEYERRKTQNCSPQRSEAKVHSPL